MAMALAPQVARNTTGYVQWAGFFAAAIAGVAVLLIPASHELSTTAHRILAVVAFTVMVWAFKVMNYGVASVLMMALLIASGVQPAVALSGFSSPAFWMLLAVLFYGFAMQRTGLAERIAYHILLLFPGTYSGILAAFFVIGAVLAFGIPSMTVRTAIMAPIAWSLVQVLGLEPRSRGSALILLTSIEMAVIPGCVCCTVRFSGLSSLRPSRQSISP